MPDNTSLPVLGYTKLSHTTSYLQSAVLLVFRLAFGWKMYLSGYRHLHNVPAMIDRFKDWGIPLPKMNVYISGYTEEIGGILLMAGLATQLICIPLTINFIVAILTAGASNVKQLIHGGQILKPDDYAAGHLGGLEAVIDDTAFPFLAISAILLAFGAGKVSIDYLIWYFFIRKPAPPAAPEGFPVRPGGTP